MVTNQGRGLPNIEPILYSVGDGSHNSNGCISWSYGAFQHKKTQHRLKDSGFIWVARVLAQIFDHGDKAMIHSQGQIYYRISMKVGDHIVHVIITRLAHLCRHNFEHNSSPIRHEHNN